MTVADVAAIRTRFPALARRHNGLPVAYFDGPGGTQVPRDVADAVNDYLLHHNANTHWRYPTSQETDAALSGAREALADFLNASPEEVSFGANMTTLTFHLARALGRGFAKGDEIVVTELDHHANVDPWRALERERGVVLKTVPFEPATGQLDLGALRKLLGPRTRLLAIGAASNALGTINDVAAATHAAHAAGALVFVDAVHFAAHGLVNVRAFDCDFLACSAYKFYGPHVGVLFARKGSLDGLDVPKLRPAPDSAPERIETGTLNHEGIVGAGAAVDFLASLAQGPAASRRAKLGAVEAAQHSAGQALVERLWEGLRTLDKVKVLGPPPSAPRTPTLSFAVAGHPSDQVATALARRAVFVSNGDFYATTAIERLGYAAEGVVRAGCASYTTTEEVDRLIEGVREVAGG